MAFKVGDSVVCVDASLANNPWHRRHPLIEKRVYVVHAFAGPHCIEIDPSGRAWEKYRFRPVRTTDTGMAIINRLLLPKPKKARSKERA